MEVLKTSLGRINKNIANIPWNLFGNLVSNEAPPVAWRQQQGEFQIISQREKVQESATLFEKNDNNLVMDGIILTEMLS